MRLLSFLGNNPYSNAIRNIKVLLDNDQKKRSIGILLLLLTNAFFDVLGLSLILPITKIALQTSLIQTNEYVKFIYDFIGIQDEILFLLVLSLILLAIFVLKNVFSIFILYIQSRFAFNIAHRLNKKQFQYYYQQGYLHIIGEDSGTKAYNIQYIPFLFAANYILPVLIFTTEFVVALIILVSMFIYNPLLAIVTISTILPAFATIYYFIRIRVKLLGEKRNNLYPKVYNTILESLAAYQNVKLSNKEQDYLTNYSDKQQGLYKLDVLIQGVYQNLSQRSNEIIAALGIVTIFLFTYLFPNNQSSLVTILALFGVAAFRVMPSFNKMMNALILIKNHSYTCESLKHLKGKEVFNFKVVDKLKFEQSLTLKNIYYNYPKSDKTIIKNLNLNIKKGELIGFIGGSGSGKTTLLNIILGFIYPYSGKILVDDQIITKDNISNFQKNIGLVQQDIFIKNGTLKENIAFGEAVKNIDETKLRNAIKDAMLTELINSNEEGDEMILGENGANLSGGQKQRIGIARALYKEASIVIFDEATSALDMDTENAITTTINNLSKLNKTIILVAHRITTLNNCQRIYELEAGQIKKEYRYEELYSERFSKITE